MKKLYINLVALLISAFSFAQGALMEFKMSSTKGANGTFVMKHSEYGSKVEMNMMVPQMPGGGIKMSTLMQKDKPEIIYSINEANKTYTEQKRSAGTKDVEDKNTYTVKKIGEEKVNGYKCIHALVTTQGKETYEIWNTKDIPDYTKYEEAMNSNKKMSSGKRQQALKDAGCDGFAVKTIFKGNDREGDVTMELLKMEKKNFSKSDFEIPSGYTKSESGSGSSAMPAGMKSQEEIMKMTPEERTKYIEEMKKKYGK